MKNIKMLLRLFFFFLLFFTFSCSNKKDKIKINNETKISSQKQDKEYEINGFLFLKKGLNLNETIDLLKENNVNSYEVKSSESESNSIFNFEEYQLKKMNDDEKDFLKRIKIIDGENFSILDFKQNTFEIIFFDNKLVNFTCKNTIIAEGETTKKYNGNSLDDFNSWWPIVFEKDKPKMKSQINFVQELKKGLEYKYGPASKTITPDSQSSNLYGQVNFWFGNKNRNSISYVRLVYSDQYTEDILTTYDLLPKEEKNKMDVIDLFKANRFPIKDRYKFKLENEFWIDVVYDNKQLNFLNQYSYNLNNTIEKRIKKDEEMIKQKEENEKNDKYKKL